MRRAGSAAIAIVLGACAPAESEPVARRADAIQGGRTEQGSSFAVAVLDASDGVCSGTLLAPNLVLTARHCVADDNGGATIDCAKDVFSPPRAPSAIRVATDVVAPSFAEAPYRVAKIVVPSDTSFCGADVALLVLSSNVSAAVAKPASPAIAPPLTDRKTYGTKIVAIGFGTTAAGASDDGTRRRRDGIPIACIPGDATLGCNPADWDMTAAEMAAGDGLCEGDSGSGAYEPASLAAGTPLVMGVLSRAGENGTRCVDAIYARTDAHAPLIVAAAKEAASAGGYAPPAWASGDVNDAGADALPGGGGEPEAEHEPPAEPKAAPASGGSSGCASAPAPADDPTSRGRALVVAIAAVAAAARRARARRPR